MEQTHPQSSKPSKHAVLLLMLAVFLSGCGEKSKPTANISPKPEVTLGAYAAAVIQRNAALVSSNGPVSQTLTSPLSYLTVFKAKNFGIAPPNANARLAATNQWQEAYCTDELRVLMAQHQITIASAKLVDADGQTQSLAICTKSVVKEAPPNIDTGSTSAGEFTSVQVCKAALSVIYRRDVSIMQGAVVEGFAQVKYVRPTDSREMSYRCKLSDGLVLTWDDSLAGARWYGNQPNDSQVRYSTSGNQLLVQDIVGGQVNREARFSLLDLKS